MDLVVPQLGGLPSSWAPPNGNQSPAGAQTAFELRGTSIS